MKTPSSKWMRFLSVLCVAIWAMGPRTSAQTPPRLELQLYAGLSITGTVDTVYSIQYVTDLAHTNASDWRTLTFLQLLATNYLWFDPAVPVTGWRFYRAVQFDAPTNMVFIPPGTFKMGSPTNEVGRYDGEDPQTAVTITSGFWMGKYPMTQGEYQVLMGSHPSFFNGIRTGGPSGDYGTDLSRPVETVSWSDAMNYLGKFTQQERTAGRIATNGVYRLPTEAEWEYACRAWTSTRFSYGDDPGYTNLANYAWYDKNSNSRTHPVGQKLPNPWGLYDMHGNVWEWCQDYYDYYPGGIALDPNGPATLPSPGAYHVGRGGFSGAVAYACRSAERYFGFSPDSKDFSFGFRVVLASSRP